MIALLGKLIGAVRGGVQRPFRSAGATAGMTLIEIIIVVALLASLMGVLVKNVLDQAEGAKQEQTRILMGNIAGALDMYRLYSNKFPTTAEGLEALLEKPSSAKRWRGPYLANPGQLKDVWDNPFDYKSDGRKYEIVSSGKSGEFGDEDDIYYPAREEEQEE